MTHRIRPRETLAGIGVGWGVLNVVLAALGNFSTVVDHIPMWLRPYIASNTAGWVLLGIAWAILWYAVRHPSEPTDISAVYRENIRHRQKIEQLERELAALQNGIVRVAEEHAKSSTRFRLYLTLISSETNPTNSATHFSAQVSVGVPRFRGQVDIRSGDDRLTTLESYG